MVYYNFGIHFLPCFAMMITCFFDYVYCGNDDDNGGGDGAKNEKSTKK